MATIQEDLAALTKLAGNDAYKVALTTFLTRVATGITTAGDNSLLPALVNQSTKVDFKTVDGITYLTDPGVAPVTGGTTTPVVTPTPTRTLVGQIACGRTAPVTTSQGVFAADPLTGPKVFPSTASIADTVDQALYQGERFDTTLEYALHKYMPIAPNATYQVVLPFAELWWGAVGQRVFDVAINTTRVLQRYDIFAKVGKNRATTESFTVQAGADGSLTLKAYAVAAAGGVDNAKLTAIQVFKLS